MADTACENMKPEVVSESSIRWSAEIDELAKALPKAQKALKRLEPDARNDHFKRDYASLGAALEACLDAYNDNNISVIQIPTTRNGLVCVTTRLLHESTQWLEADIYIRPESEAAQKIGTAATYGRRYMLTSIAGLAPSEEAPPAAEAAAKAKDEGKRLTKAMARDLFEKMQGGLRKQSSAGAVRKWLGHFDDDLKTLPVDQERELRDEAQQEIEAHEAAQLETQGAGF